MLEIFNFSCLQYSLRVHKPVKTNQCRHNLLCTFGCFIAAFHIAHQIDQLLFLFLIDIILLRLMVFELSFLELTLNYLLF